MDVYLNQVCRQFQENQSICPVFQVHLKRWWIHSSFNRSSCRIYSNYTGATRNAGTDPDCAQIFSPLIKSGLAIDSLGAFVCVCVGFGATIFQFLPEIVYLLRQILCLEAPMLSAVTIAQTPRIPTRTTLLEHYIFFTESHCISTTEQLTLVFDPR